MAAPEIACPPGCSALHELNQSDARNGTFTHVWRAMDVKTSNGPAHICLARADQADPPVRGETMLYLLVDATMTADQALMYATALRAQALLLRADQVGDAACAVPAFGDFVEAWLGNRALNPS